MERRLTTAASVSTASSYEGSGGSEICPARRPALYPADLPGAWPQLARPRFGGAGLLDGVQFLELVFRDPVEP